MLSCQGNDAYRQLKGLLSHIPPTTSSTLSVSDLSNRMNKSTTPVREALFQLAARGIVDYKPKTGFELPKLDAKDLSIAQNRFFSIILNATSDIDRKMIEHSKMNFRIEASHTSEKTYDIFYNTQFNKYRNCNKLISCTLLGTVDLFISNLILDAIIRFQNSAISLRNVDDIPNELIDYINLTFQQRDTCNFSKSVINYSKHELSIISKDISSVFGT